MNGLLDWDFNFSSFAEIPNYNTRNKNNLVKPHSYKTWGQIRFVCHCVDDWNSLPGYVRTLLYLLTVLSLQLAILKFSDFLS